MDAPAALDPARYRRVVGRFATGVTLVTTYDGSSHVGMTANSFTSVSLDPVLVLVSIEKVARFHDVVLSTRVFAVGVLASSHEEISRAYALRGSAKDPSALGRPGPRTGCVLLDGALATLECTLWAVYDGGDHSLVVGEVVGMAASDAPDEPLLFYAGAYRSLAR